LNELWRLEDQLLAIEARIGLLDACRPLGLGREEARIQALLDDQPGPSPAGLVPKLDWPVRPSLDLDLHQLEQVAAACARLEGTDLGRILRLRAEELALDAQLVRARGTPEMLRLAGRRFRGALAAERQGADALAREWLGQKAPDTEPAELVELAAELRRLSLSQAIELDVVEVDMAARAAVTATAVFVRRGARVTVLQAARIFAHEVFGHALPRRAALTNGPPFRIGPSGADADEEGRAVHLEAALGYLDAERRLELAARHLLAAHVLDGGHVGEGLLDLYRRGVPSRILAQTAPRVLRGGGLCREIIYLPAFLRVGPRLAEREVERVFLAGRATLDEVGALGRLLAARQGDQSRSATTGV
jgi:hypothetical protein